MSQFTVRKSGGIERKPGKWYHGTYEGWEHKPGGQYGDQIEWHFQLEDKDGNPESNADGEPRQQFIWTGDVITPDTKFGHLYSGFTGKTIKPGMEIDLDEDIPLGLRIKIMWMPEPKATSGVSAKVFALESDD